MSKAIGQSLEAGAVALGRTRVGRTEAAIPTAPRNRGVEQVSAKLKPIAEQTIVITGASSGIGLATARMAVRRGAKLMLAARSGDALAEIGRAGRRDRDGG